MDETFFCVIAPGWLDHFIYNEYYKTDEEFIFALADALREEYLAIVNAGFILQIDDPGLVDWWDMLKPALSVDEYRDKFARLRIDAINHALKGIPEDRVRYHLCWGSWHGPHTHDLPFEHIVGLMLQVKAQCYSFEAANVRHEHEWKLWNDVKLPDGKMILPGVVSHSTNLVEHPELVAERIVRFAGAVGRENVIAGTDCGLGGRVHAEIAWAKLGALVEGARLASKSAVAVSRRRHSGARSEASEAGIQGFSARDRCSWIPGPDLRVGPGMTSEIAKPTCAWALPWRLPRGAAADLRLLGLAAFDREFELRLPAQVVRLALALAFFAGRGLGRVLLRRDAALERVHQVDDVRGGRRRLLFDTGAPACLRLSMSTTASS